MANATAPLIRRYASPQGALIVRPTGGAIFEGTMVAQLTSGAALVAATTALSGRVVGIATHSAESGAALELETDRVVIMENAPAGSDPVAAGTALGATLYALDDHTVKTTATGSKPVAGVYYGLDPDGRVRVKLSLA